jgi:hypothetical protein
VKRSLGCLTGLGLIAALITAVAIVGAAAASGNGIFSPGGLSAKASATPLGGVNTHAELAGQCDACHVPAWSTERMGDRCLGCHTEIQAELSNPASLHFVFADGGNCRDCHTEHHGPQASLTRADMRGFPHDRVGFSLDVHRTPGEGGTFSCEDCHGATVRAFHIETCANCHQVLNASFMAEHVATFGSSCLDCHDGHDRFGKAFNHRAVAFSLDGKHAEIPCSQCHMGARTVEALQQTPTACVACHQSQDIHEGRLGQACDQCHRFDSWQNATIDHALTGFTLTASHLSADCQGCHVGRQWHGIPTSCVGCHTKDDPHAGQFKNEDCSDCHEPTRWQDLHFDHSRTNFVLADAHSQVACADCHANGRFAGTPTTCIGCHQKNDAHGGELGTDCGSCHKPTRWKDVTFNHASVFALDGKHASVDCAACHTTPGHFSGLPTKCSGCHQKDDAHGGELGTDCGACHKATSWSDVTFNHNSVFALTGKHASIDCTVCHTTPGHFAGLPTNCAGCHQKDDAHNGELGSDCGSCHRPTTWSDVTFNHSSVFALTGKHASIDCAACHTTPGHFSGLPTNCAGCHQKDDAHNGDLGTNCGSCHRPTTWSDVTFNHNSVFALVGKHASLNCAACHTTPGQFAGLPTNCVGCHLKDDAHGGQFGTDCGSCHNPTSWTNATFDHSKSGFPLTGAHTSLPCTSCHTGGKFTGLSPACSSCHAEPAVHAGQFGTNCSTCHSTSAWLPASFNGPHPFPMSHGGANGQCAKCHPSSLTSYTCYNCHNQAETVTHHQQQGINDLSNCVGCHPSGKGN